MLKPLIISLLIFCLIIQASHAEAQSGFFLKTMLRYDHSQTQLFRADINDQLRSEELAAASGTLRHHSPTPNHERDDDGQSFFSNGPVPDWTDHETVMVFLNLSWNAYLPRNDPTWRPVPGLGESEYADPFGWDFDNHLRGYIFSNLQNQVVVAFKGTDISGDTSSNDLYQDWLMFSCCGEGTITRPGCGCDFTAADGNPVCNVSCVGECVQNHGHDYFNASLAIYELVHREYPNAELYFTGHSLGGAIAALLANAVQYPAVAFESPPERGYAWLLGYDGTDSVLANLPIFHFGNDCDPIYLGGDTCLECVGTPIRSKCHLGYKCTAHINSFCGISAVMSWHRLTNVGNYFNANPLPNCVPDLDCSDCESWEWTV